MNKTKGFTIIELIIAILIVAILAAFVISNVVGYIGKSKDAAIKSNVGLFEVQAANYYLKNKKFSSLCEQGVDQDVQDILDKFSGENCHSDGERWVLCVPLNLGGAWCADDSGLKKEISMESCENNSVKSCTETNQPDAPGMKANGSAAPGQSKESDMKEGKKK